WAKTRTISFKADDASSGVEYITYDITGPSPKSGTINASSGPVTLAADGEYTINYDIYDVAGQMTSVSLPYKADTVNPANTSLAALTAWQTPALKLAITGSDDRSGVDHGEWRVDGGAAQTGSPPLVTSEGTQLFETRVVDKAGNASAWRPETIKVD